MLICICRFASKTHCTPEIKCIRVVINQFQTPTPVRLPNCANVDLVDRRGLLYLSMHPLAVHPGHTTKKDHVLVFSLGVVVSPNMPSPISCGYNASKRLEPNSSILTQSSAPRDISSHQIVSSVLIVHHLFVAFTFNVRIFSNRDLDALKRKRFTQRCAFTHARKLLGRIHAEVLAVARGQDWCTTLVDMNWQTTAGSSNINKREPQSGESKSALKNRHSINSYFFALT